MRKMIEVCAFLDGQSFERIRRPFCLQGDRRIFPVHAILEQWRADEAGSAKEIRIERINYVVPLQEIRHPAKPAVDRPLNPDRWPEATGIRTTSRQRFEAVVRRL